MTRWLLPFRREGLEQLSDDALVANCAAGDNAALEELFHRHGDNVHRVLDRLLPVDRQDIEDMVQATFVEVKRSAARFDFRSAVTTWIFGIALNLARNSVRTHVRQRRAMEAVAETDAFRDGHGPEERASQRQLIARLQAAFDALPPDLRTVFTLCDLEGLRGVDVARILKIPQGTVWRRLHDARTRLRLAIEGEGEGGER
jgi:RNA polymerase sigma-70 factor (ECF subfamily)